MKTLENRKSILRVLCAILIASSALYSCNKDEGTIELEYRVQCGVCKSSLLNEVGGLVQADVEGSYSFTRKHAVGEAAQIIVDRTSDSVTMYTQILKGGQVMVSDSAMFPKDELKLTWLVK
ncbi:MAG: hypothetical protein EP332_11415 [Bacteroidetes bacterium]|nr:MAG: hypothetical protein EP332_11415 [Bacteroidota bacterium]